MKLTLRLAAPSVALVSLFSLAACGADVGGGSVSASDDLTLTVGFVTTQTGPIAAFSDGAEFAIDQMTDYFAKNPIEAGGKSFKVKVVTADSQSDPARAGQVTADLINNKGAEIIFAAGTAGVDDPVIDQCEANSVPCLTTVSPWQPIAYRGDDETPADLAWTHHFFWGLEDAAQVYSNIWSAVPNNGKVGGLFPNDTDGASWQVLLPEYSDPAVTWNDPGAYPNGTQDFSAQIAGFKAAGDDILAGVPVPPDFTTFWKQAKQQGFEPKVATIARAVLFPSSVEAVGDIANNVSTEVWWHPTSPFASSLTGQTAQQFADAYEESTGQQWSQPLGFAEALFEVAAAGLEKAGSTDAVKLNAAFDGLSVDTIVGNITWGSDAGVPSYIAKTPLAGGQWRTTDGGKHPFDLVVVENSLDPQTPLGGKPEALTW